MITNFGSETFPHNLPTLASVWDLASGEVRSTLKRHTDFVRSVAITPDGKSIISGSDDKSLR